MHQQTGTARIVDVDADGERLRVAVGGELDLASVGVVEDDVVRRLGFGFAELLLDLREVDFIDSTGLRLLVRLDARAREAGVSFALDPGEGAPRRLLELTGLTGRFHCVAAPGRSAT